MAPPSRVAARRLGAGGAAIVEAPKKGDVDQRRDDERKIPMASLVIANQGASSPVVEVTQSPFGVQEPEPLPLDGLAPGTIPRRP